MAASASFNVATSQESATPVDARMAVGFAGVVVARGEDGVVDEFGHEVRVGAPPACQRSVAVVRFHHTSGSERCIQVAWFQNTAKHVEQGAQVSWGFRKLGTDFQQSDGC